MAWLCHSPSLSRHSRLPPAFPAYVGGNRQGQPQPHLGCMPAGEKSLPCLHPDITSALPGSKETSIDPTALTRAALSLIGLLDGEESWAMHSGWPYKMFVVRHLLTAHSVCCNHRSTGISVKCFMGFRVGLIIKLGQESPCKHNHHL